MRMFRLLREDEIECRIAEIKKDGSGLILLLYKTSRTDAALLDETVGPMNWTDDYKEVLGQLHCGIGIKDETGNYVWKWNCGTESYMDAEKGRASDAFKRAGFTWGIGAELYTAPKIMISSKMCNIREYDGRKKCYDNFSVWEIGYDNNEKINYLVIRNDTEREFCFRFGKPPVEESPKTPEKNPEPPREPDTINYATPNQVAVIRKLCNEEEIQAIKNKYDVSGLALLPRTKAVSIIKKLKERGRDGE